MISGNITAKEYDRIASAVKNKPLPEDGFLWKLSEKLEWVKAQVEYQNNPDIDDTELLNILMGGD